jgi:hypothetical protein
VAAIAADLVARAHAPEGVHAPEAALEPAAVLDALAERDIHVAERLVPRPPG